MTVLTGATHIQIAPREGVYVPTVDSSLLREAFAVHGPSESAAVLDLCCGSGVQGISAALHGHRVDAVDADRAAVFSTRHNAALNGVWVGARHGDLFEPVAGIRYSEILVNPPYVPTPIHGRISRHGWCDGGSDGRIVIDRICREAGDYLQPGGALWMVHSSLAGIDQTVRDLRSQGFEVDAIAEHEEPFGPISLERLHYLRTQGYAGQDDTTELLVVLRAELD